MNSWLASWIAWLPVFGGLVLTCAPSESLAQGATRIPASSGGSVLRQVSGIQGFEPIPDGMPDATVSDGAAEVFRVDDPPPSHWINSHEIAPLGPRVGLPWPWCGDSIIPSCRGPRTPQRFRHQGLGEPLIGTSWNNRPFSAGWFAGAVFGDPLIAGRVNQGTGFYGGFRLGWDYDYYFGLETRVGGAAIGLHDVNHATIPRTSDYITWDIDLLYYPWGDSRWRPYFLVGTGVSVSHFEDDLGNSIRHGQFMAPLGFGLKYRCNEYLVARMEFVDNISFASAELATMNNLSFNVGVEVRFGGVRKSYWPWNPGRHLW